MTRALVRGACPSLPEPMPTGDGLLARFLPIAPMTLDAFIGLCEAARAHGNGTMEISARGSLQIRGLSPLSAPRFAAAIAALDIDIAEGVPVLADPLPNDPSTLLDANGVAAELRRAIARAGLTLAPKVSVVIDGGGRLDLDALTADVRLRAVPASEGPRSEGPRFELALAGDAASAVPVATIAAGEAVDAVLALLTAIAARGPEARARDVLETQSGLPASRAQCQRSPRAHPIGSHPLNDGAFALGLGLAFGHAEAGALMELAEAASAEGALWARPAPGRALLLGSLGATNVEAVRRAAELLGLVTQSSDPRRRIVACPGAPFCAQGLIAARALAAEIARHVSRARALPGDGTHARVALHVSGCAKGCAYPQAAPLTIVGTAQGCGIVRDGTAQAPPAEHVDPADLAARLERIAAETREAVHA
jgi:precorrin-3B synthase